MSRTRTMLLPLVAILLSPMVAKAAVIDFNGIGINDEDPVTVDGFVFDYLDQNGWAIAPVEVLSNGVGNGTEFITCRDTVDFACSIRMSSADSSGFTLGGFDLADHSLGFGGFDLFVTFNLVGGGSVGELFSTVADEFTTVTTTTGLLSSVLFSWAGTSGNDGFALDNIVVDAASVPEPGTLALLGVSLLGMGAARHRKKA